MWVRARRRKIRHARGGFTHPNSHHHAGTVTGQPRWRRLASPVRVSLAIDLGGDLDGAWWPRTSSEADELADLADALFGRLGRIVDIAVNWSTLTSSPDLDSLNCSRLAHPGRAAGPQRIMTVSGAKGPARLMVIPCRTSVTLALMVLRRAADLPIEHTDRNTPTFAAAEHIVRAARAEGARCAGGPAELDPLAAAPRAQT
jgi:hypothetical protein